MLRVLGAGGRRFESCHPDEKYFTYVLQSLATRKTYIGQTSNIIDRITRHNSSRNIYTKNKGPWKLIFIKEFSTRTEAITREKKLKCFKSRDYLLKWIRD